MDEFRLHRPRNLDWRRAAALLYGDWGTSKAYVIGIAFSGTAWAAGYSALPIILAVCALTALVAFNYILVCRHYPDGGGVYSAARLQSRFLAVLGALLLVANFTVTAAMSGWAAMSYFRVPTQWVAPATIALIVLLGAVNYFGPKHSGSFAVTLAVPMAVVVVIIIALSFFTKPGLNTSNLAPPLPTLRENWICFVNMILALSGVEAIANLTGVMKLDSGSSMDKPIITRTATFSIVIVAVEVVAGTALLGWAMLSLPGKGPALTHLLHERWEDMLSLLGEQYAALAFGAPMGKIFGIVVGVIVGLLLISAVNTAIAALIGLMYLLARDGEMPRSFTRLNSFGVPWWPMFLALLLPISVVAIASDLTTLMGLYAIGVVGAIAVNLGSCTFNRHLHLALYERVIMGVTFVILFAVEFTIARTKPDALFFAVCVLGLGLALRGWAQRRAGLRTLTVAEHVAAAVAPDQVPPLTIDLRAGQTIMVAARGVNPVLGFALEEARLRNASLYVVYVKEVAVSLPTSNAVAGQPRWQDDPAASQIMYRMLEVGRENKVPVVPVYSVSDDPAGTILDLAATVGADILVLGTPHRTALVSLLKGNVVTAVAKNLPENIQLLIFG